MVEGAATTGEGTLGLGKVGFVVTLAGGFTTAAREIMVRLGEGEGIFDGVLRVVFALLLRVALLPGEGLCLSGVVVGGFVGVVRALLSFKGVKVREGFGLGTGGLMLWGTPLVSPREATAFPLDPPSVSSTRGVGVTGSPATRGLGTGTRGGDILGQNGRSSVVAVVAFVGFTFL